MQMKRIIHMGLAGLTALFAFSACSDWVTPEANNYEPGGLQGSSRSDEYYAALREWKASRTVDENGIPNRSVTFAWYSDWSGVGSNMSNQLMGLPDSVDFISIWGNWNNLTPEKHEDLRKVKEIKGTKCLLCFIVANVGDQTTPPEVRQNWSENGYSSEQEAVNAYWGWDDADDGEAAIRKYARSIMDTIAKYGWDGFDLDLEPNYGSPGDISSHPDRLSFFLDEMSKEYGPASGSEKMLCVDGEPDILNPSDGLILDYFIIQAYNDGSVSSIDGRLSRLIRNYDGVLSPEAVVGKTILTSNFESYASTGGPTFRNRDGETTFQLNGFAQYYYPGVNSPIGGIGAFRVVFDTNYNFYRQAMKTLHSYVYPWEMPAEGGEGAGE